MVGLNQKREGAEEPWGQGKAGSVAGGEAGRGSSAEPRAPLGKGQLRGEQGANSAPPQGTERFGLPQIPLCQVALFPVIILCGLI